MFKNVGSHLAGKVYLVGAGPGDPDLLTVKAMRTLGLADVVLHDALVSEEVLALASPQGRVMNVGKRCGRKSITQEQINSLLVRFASAGEVVVRLKSGDPSIFGRAGEELDALRAAGIEAEIIPGVTASLAAAARIGVSLTDRRKADQLLFISAHRGQGKQDSNWQPLVNRRTTIVVYMPGEYQGVADDLSRAGLSEATPCAVVSQVSTPNERWYQTTLGSLNHARVMASPCVLIVGETVKTIAPEKFRPDTLQGPSFQGDFRTPARVPTEA